MGGPTGLDVLRVSGLYALTPSNRVTAGQRIRSLRRRILVGQGVTEFGRKDDSQWGGCSSVGLVGCIALQAVDDPLD